MIGVLYAPNLTIKQLKVNYQLCKLALRPEKTVLTTTIDRNRNDGTYIC